MRPGSKTFPDQDTQSDFLSSPPTYKDSSDPCSLRCNSAGSCQKQGPCCRPWHRPWRNPSHPCHCEARCTRGLCREEETWTLRNNRDLELLSAPFGQPKRVRRNERECHYQSSLPRLQKALITFYSSSNLLIILRVNPVRGNRCIDRRGNHLPASAFLPEACTKTV